MEKITMKTTDIFKAAYLYYRCDYPMTVVHKAGKIPLYVFTGGSSLESDEKNYIGGGGIMEVISMKEALLSLMQRTGQAILAVPDRD